MNRLECLEPSYSYSTREIAIELLNRIPYAKFSQERLEDFIRAFERIGCTENETIGKIGCWPDGKGLYIIAQILDYQLPIIERLPEMYLRLSLYFAAEKRKNVIVKGGFDKKKEIEYLDEFQEKLREKDRKVLSSK